MDRLFLSRWFSPLFVIFMALVTVAVYSNTFTAAFQYDDGPIIRDNHLLRDLGNIREIVNNIRGFTLLTFAVNYAIGGLDVRGYHAVNLAVHIINASLAYLLVLATLRLVKVQEGSSRRLAAFSALLFAVHPIQTQAVTYIVQRMESLSGMFYLLALLLFIGASRASGAIKRGALYTGVALSYLLAFYFKEITYTLPAVIVLYDYLFIARGSLGEMLRKWPVYALLALLFAYFTYMTVVPLGGFNDLSEESAAESIYAAPIVKDLSGLEDGAGAPAGKTRHDYTAGFNVSRISPEEYLYTQFNVIVYYLALLAVPANQNLDYDFPWASGLFKAPEAAPGTALNFPMPPPALSLAILLVITGAAAYLLLRSRKDPDSKARVAAFFILWFFIILSPTSSFIPIADAIYEHRVYLASLGYFFIFVLVVDSAVNRLFSRLQRNPGPEGV